MTVWSPEKVLRRETTRLLGEVADQIENSAPRVPHRDGIVVTAGRRPGGSLARLVRGLRVVFKAWGAVVPFSTLGQKLHWFVHGTAHQDPRPVSFVPDEKELARELEADALGAFERVEVREGSGS